MRRTRCLTSCECLDLLTVSTFRRHPILLGTRTIDVAA